MVLCVIGDYGTKSGRGKVGVYSVPAIITQQGKEFEELRKEKSLDFHDRLCQRESRKCFPAWSVSSHHKLRQVQCRLGSDTSLNQERVQEKDVKASAERSE